MTKRNKNPYFDLQAGLVFHYACVMGVSFYGYFNLVQKIQTTFFGINRLSTSLAQYWFIDQKGIDGTITDEEWEEAKIKRHDSKWQDVSGAEIDKYGSLLAYMDAVDFT